jgi:hypothetical protein
VSIQNLLNQLDQIFETLGVNSKLAAPITDEALQDLTQKLPFKIPSDLEQLYKWHNGMDEFIPAYDLLSLSDAIAEYEALVASAREFQDEDFFKHIYFPILQFQDSWFLVDCDPGTKTNVYYLFLEDGTVKKEYESFEQMLQIVVDAYLSRAFYIEDDLVVENPVLLQKIENKYLSQEQRDEREAHWNKLCIQLHELKSRELAQMPPSEEEAHLGELYAGLGLAAPNTLFKKSLIRQLYETCDERAIEYMVEFLDDTDPEIVANAAFGLGDLKARERLPELLKLLKHPAEVVRNLSAHAIGNIISPNDKLLLQPLLDLLTDEATLVRIAAVVALGQLRSQKAVLSLINLLQDRNSGIRSEAIHALGKIGDSRALEALRNQQSKVLSDEGRWIERNINLIERANS